MNAVLQFNNVSYERDGVTVLSDIDLTTNARRIGLVGRNGSGKSSLARLITGLAKPSRGNVRVLGGNVAADRAFALSNVGMIFQNPDQQIIFPTVGEEIAFGLENLGLSSDAIRQRTEQIMTRFNWKDWYDRSVYTLSHGQKHLLCLMAVLVMEPKLIVFDEPYASLDIPTATQMRGLMSGLSQHVLVISHTPADLEGFQELIWVEDGRVAEHGPIAEVLPRYLSAMNTVIDEGAQC